MTDPQLATLGTASAAMYATMAATSRIIDVLVAKNVLKRNEAAATLTATAEEIRDDAGGTPAEEPAEAICKWLDDLAKGYR